MLCGSDDIEGHLGSTESAYLEKVQRVRETEYRALQVGCQLKTTDVVPNLPNYSIVGLASRERALHLHFATDNHSALQVGCRLQHANAELSQDS